MTMADPITAISPADEIDNIDPVRLAEEAERAARASQPPLDPALADQLQHQLDISQHQLDIFQREDVIKHQNPAQREIDPAQREIDPAQRDRADETSLEESNAERERVLERPFDVAQQDAAKRLDRQESYIPDTVLDSGLR
jgi:hypothetical protein